MTYIIYIYIREILLGHTQNLYLVDLWKMKICKIFKAGESPIITFEILNDSEIVAISKRK